MLSQIPAWAVRGPAQPQFVSIFGKPPWNQYSSKILNEWWTIPYFLASVIFHSSKTMIDWTLISLSNSLFDKFPDQYLMFKGNSSNVEKWRSVLERVQYKFQIYGAMDPIMGNMHLKIIWSEKKHFILKIRTLRFFKE